MFRVGQKVVCVVDMDGGICDKYGAGFFRGLRQGTIYTVTRSPDGLGFMSVAGITGSWCHTRFRPIVERKTDISIFTKMLTPSKRRVQERA